MHVTHVLLQGLHLREPRGRERRRRRREVAVHGPHSSAQRSSVRKRGVAAEAEAGGHGVAEEHRAAAAELAELDELMSPACMCGMHWCRLQNKLGGGVTSECITCAGEVVPEQ